MTIDGNEFIKSWIYSIMTCVIDILTFMMILMGQKVRWMQEVHLGMGIKRSIWCGRNLWDIFIFEHILLRPDFFRSRKNMKYFIEWKIDKALTQKWWIEYHKNILFQLFLFISRYWMRCRLWIFFECMLVGRTLLIMNFLINVSNWRFKKFGKITRLKFSTIFLHFHPLTVH